MKYIVFMYKVFKIRKVSIRKSNILCYRYLYEWYQFVSLRVEGEVYYQKEKLFFRIWFVYDWSGYVQ